MPDFARRTPLLRIAPLKARFLLAGLATAALAGCMTQSDTGVGGGGLVDSASTDILPAAAPAPGWQWSDPDAMGATKTGSATLQTANVSAPGAPGPHIASVGLHCLGGQAQITFTWDLPVGAGSTSMLSYQFAGQPGHDVVPTPDVSYSQVVSDPLVISRFIDEAAASRQLVVRVSSSAAGAAQATFDASDSLGNLTRFRSACPVGTN